MPSNRDHIEQGASGFEAEIEDLQDEVKTLRSHFMRLLAALASGVCDGE